MNSNIRRFYLHGFAETARRDWPRLWSKQFKIQAPEGCFLKLNRFRPRLNFRSLLNYCVRFAPLHLYMSVLNWLMPERVGEKRRANSAYPIGGEYVVDVDLNLFWRPHSHYVGLDGVCAGCLSMSRDITLALLDKIRENYSDVCVVFSGKRGFHIHVLDFEVMDWTHYNDRDPIKSHEVARLVYTKLLKSVCGGFDDHHFKLSVDVMRVITFPGSLNGETGLICSHLGGPKDFERASVSDVLWRSRALKYIYNADWESLVGNYAHPEPNLRLVGR